MKIFKKNYTLVQCIITIVRVILFMLSLGVAYYYLSFSLEIYQASWNSYCYDNPTAGIFISSCILLQLMFFLHFPKIRYILMILGAYGIILMSLKLYLFPLPVEAHDFIQTDNWPTPNDIRKLRLDCGILLFQGLIFNYYSHFIKFILLKPIKHAVLYLYQKIFPVQIK